MSIRTTVFAALMLAVPALAAAAPTPSVFVVSDLDDVQNFDSSDYVVVPSGGTAIEKSWTLENADGDPAENAFDKAYLLTVDAQFGEDSEASDFQFYIGTAPDDISSSVLTLFSGAFDNEPGEPFNIVKTFLIDAQSTYYINVAATGQYKGSMDFVLTASEASAVPLPAALPLMAAGLGALGLVARRRRG